MTEVSHLIVQRFFDPPEGFDALLQTLAEKHGVDLFQGRHRLIGQGLSRFAEGPALEMEKLSETLASGGIIHWQIVPQPVQFAPKRIFALETDSSRVVFDCRQQQVIFPRDGRVLAILADISGTLAERVLGRIVSGNAYMGRSAVRSVEQEQLRDMILQNQPVLDLYLLDENLNIAAGVRVFPGRFNPSGLGEEATLSSRRNLEQVLELVSGQARELRLYTGFGLDNLPGCQVRKLSKDDSDGIRLNLAALTRYGWLLANLWRAGEAGASSEAAQVHPLFSPLIPPLAAVLPEILENSGGATLNPLMQEVVAAMGNDDLSGTRPQPQSQVEEPLLLPPPATAPLGWTPARIWSVLGFFGGTAAGFLFLAADQSDLVDRALYHSFASGAAPMGFALVFLWLGFYQLRIKRTMENTPTSRIRSVAMGMVEVKGRARRCYALVSPMSHLPCVYYRLTRYRRDKSNRWQVISVTGSDNVPFYLEDETGQIEVNPRQARVMAGTRHEGVPGQIGLSRAPHDNTEKWVEETVIDGTLLYVLGFASVKEDNRLTLKEKVQQALRELKQNPDRLKEFDADGDGRICADEWDTARSVVEKRVLQQSMLVKDRRRLQQDHIVIGKQRGYPLLVAETHCENVLTARYRNQALVMFALSIAATGLAVHLLLSYPG